MLSDEQRRRLEKQKDSLQKEWDIRNDKLTQIRKTLALETDASNIFKYEQQKLIEEKQLDSLTAKIEKIEKQLQSVGHKALNTQNQSNNSDLINKILIKAESVIPDCLYEVPEIEEYSKAEVVNQIYEMEKDDYLEALPLYSQASQYPEDFQNIKITQKGRDFLRKQHGAVFQKTLNKHEIEQLSNVPVVGDEASEVGADYTELRNFLNNQEFGKADLETARLMLRIARREHEGFFEQKDLIYFPAKDIATINKLWLSGSKGRFGFSVQKEILMRLKPVGNPNYLESFIKTLEWGEENRIIYELRAVKGHLPIAIYVKLEDNVKLHKKWWAETDKYLQEERRKMEEERRIMMEKIRILVEEREKFRKWEAETGYIKIKNLWPLEVEDKYPTFLMYWNLHPKNSFSTPETPIG